ncbi:MAG: prolipoprotein diacylglyceryl transferase [Clostridia bacterium]|nr:prolipoprotein diacylglyceryl transferase [Clostridia bacterium]
MNKVAISFSPFGKPMEIRWYGILITLGIVLALFYSYKRSKDEGILLDDLLDMGIFAIVFGIIGARTYYVLTYGISNFVVKNADGKVKIWDTFVSIIGVWNGGIAIYGAIIGGALAIYFVCRHKKINWLKAFDAISPAVMIGQILGRWGNFVNGEAHGGVVSSASPLYFLRMGLQSGSKMIYVHPTFLYESMWNLVGFLIINWLYKKKKFDGQVFLMYITWYGFGRMLIEGLRTDSLMIGVFRISQVVGFVCFIVGTALLVRGFIVARRVACEGAEYEPVYKNFIKRVLPTKNNTPDMDNIPQNIDVEKTASKINASDKVNDDVIDNSDFEDAEINNYREDEKNGENN